MIESMRSYGYTLPAALADLIDNSIAAAASIVKLRFHWSGADSWVSILDDGSGMSSTEEVIIWKRLEARGFADRDASALTRVGVNEIVTILRDVAGDRTARLIT